MLPNDLSIDFDGLTHPLKKVAEQGGESVYRGEASFSGDRRVLTLSVKHTIPVTAGAKASSVCKLTMAHYDSSGTFIRTLTAHTVITSSDGLQTSWYQYIRGLLQAVMDTTSFDDEFSAGAY